MEQRRLRLGDTLDDYCPRERRVTNHAIVAMIEDDIKQTRCTTCDAEHAYKGARVPRRRKKETPAALFKEVLAGMPDTDAPPVLTVPVASAATHKGDSDSSDDTSDEQNEHAAAEPRAVEDPVMHASAEDHDPEEAGDAEPGDAQPQAAGSEDWPMHRPLIRAQLPRVEGQKEERRPTDFTIRQPGSRNNSRGHGGGARFRGPGGGQGPGQGGIGSGHGNSVRGHSSQRFAGGGRPAGGGRGPGGPGRGPTGHGGPSAGFRGGPPRQGGGKKRSR